MTIIWSEKSAKDLRLIKTEIAYDKPEAAIRFITRLKSKVDRLEKFPESGRIVPQLSRQDIREIIFSNYRIIYECHPKSIKIITVFPAYSQSFFE